MDGVEVLKRTRIRFQEARTRCVEDWEKCKKEIEESDKKLSTMGERDFIKNVRETAKQIGKFEARFEMYDMIDKWLAERIIELMEKDRNGEQASGVPDGR